MTLNVTKATGQYGAIDGQTEIDVAQYAYDALGRRIKKVDAVADSTTLYYYSDNWQVLAEYDGSGGVQAYYVFGNTIDEVLLRHVIPAQAPNQDLYYAHDHLYSPVALLDDTGAVVERCEYDAYGEVQVLSSEFLVLSSSQYGNPYYFTGREVDWFDNGNLTLQHNRHRYLSQYMGRWLSHDSLGYVDGLNLNDYVLSNPINLLDPIGQRIVRLVFTYEFKNDATRQYVPPLNKVCFVIKKILEPCFDELKCDKVRVICKEESPNLVGFVYGNVSGKPIMYLSHTYLTDKEGAATNLGFCNRGSPYCTIFAKRIDNLINRMPPSDASVRRQNLHNIFANITIHESLWHGMLGKIDRWRAIDGSFGSSVADYYPMVLTESDCKKIREKLKVE